MARRKARSNQCITGKRCIGGEKTLVAVKLWRDFSYCVSRYHLRLPSSSQSFCWCFCERELRPDFPQEEIAARFPRPLVAPGRVPITHLSQYPTAHSTDTMGSAFNFEAGKGRNAYSKQRRLTGIVGRRDQDLKKRAQEGRGIESHR